MFFENDARNTGIIIQDQIALSKGLHFRISPFFGNNLVEVGLAFRSLKFFQILNANLRILLRNREIIENLRVGPEFLLFFEQNSSN